MKCKLKYRLIIRERAKDIMKLINASFLNNLSFQKSGLTAVSFTKLELSNLVLHSKINKLFFIISLNVKVVLSLTSRRR